MEEILTHVYTAGLIDGEGTITLSHKYKNSSYRVPTVSVSSTTFELIQFLKETYGGVIVTHKTYKEHHKQSWSWRTSYNDAISMMENIQPFIKEPEKLRRINLILKEYKLLTPRNGKYTESMKLAKLQFEEKFFHPSSTID